jgi:hypothetical protein
MLIRLVKNRDNFTFSIMYDSEFLSSVKCNDFSVILCIE